MKWSFQELLEKAHGPIVIGSAADIRLPNRLLAIDPGETIGWAYFEKEKLVTWGKEATKAEFGNAVNWVVDIFAEYMPEALVMEDYRIYKWKTEQHAWSDVYTLRVIGALEFWCHRNNVPYDKQTAQIAKQFCTDDKLKAWAPGVTGAHSKDAVRHGLYWLLFHK